MCWEHHHHQGGCHGSHWGQGFGLRSCRKEKGWAYLTHEERIEHLVNAKKNLEAQLAEIQKTLDLLKPNPSSTAE